jgi:hypothetical protein
LQAPILKTLIYDPATQRSRDVREGEEGQSIWASMMEPDSRFYFRSIDGTKRSEEMPKNLVYNQADALEDEILFPHDRPDAPPKRFKAVETPITMLDSGRLEPLIFSSFVNGDDTDEGDLAELGDKFVEEGPGLTSDSEWSGTSEDDEAEAGSISSATASQEKYEDIRDKEVTTR